MTGTIGGPRSSLVESAVAQGAKAGDPDPRDGTGKRKLTAADVAQGAKAKKGKSDGG